MRRSGSRSGSRTWCSSQRHHHRPLSLLWHVALFTTAATGPASCFVTVPTSSTRVRGETPGNGHCSFFAAASPLPKFALGSLGGIARNGDTRRVYSAGSSSDREGDDGSSRQNDATCAKPGTTSNRNARGFGAVNALSAGVKGLRTAGMALKASATGVDLESRMSLDDSKPKRILFLMSDTGGGHRASSQALTAAISDLYGDQIHTDIVDIWTDFGRFPFAEAVKTYKFLGRHPLLWKLSYDIARFPPTRRMSEIMANLTCHRSFRQCLDKYQPDLVVSTHPLCHHVPLRVLKRLRAESGKHVPFVTVVTDLGSAHPTWFDPRGDLVYVPSDVLRQRAEARGIPRNKLMQFGLPVRDMFWEESTEKKAVQRKLGLKAGVRTALIVGGGDGVGKLTDIATNVADRLASDHHPGQVVVVCGTNKKTKQALDGYSWPGEGSGVTVRVLGFVSNMDEWMSAADLLVTKAGPGTIAEACTKGLPVILSSFLPGQEAGNVPYVTDNEFGLYRKDPKEIAHEVSDLLADRARLEKMGHNARSMGRPHASLDIARSLVTTMLPGTTEKSRTSPPPPASASGGTAV